MSVVKLVSSMRARTSSATPTTVYHVGSEPPKLTLRPMGSSPGKCRPAAVSLSTTTGSPSARSRSSMARPRMAMPSDSK